MTNEQFEKFIQERATVFDLTIQIHTIGAFLSPLKVTDSEGKVFWVWHVTEFTDDSYDEYGEVYNPVEIAKSREELLEYEDEDE